MGVGERRFDPAPLKLGEALSPEWLGNALAQGGAALDVRHVEIVDQFGPSCTKVRMKLEYGPAVPTEYPTAFCLKGFFGDPSMGYLKSGVQLTEAGFYREIAPVLPMRLAQCIHAGSDPATGAGVILMRDLISDGARFLGVLSPYSTAQAQASLDQLAKLHATSWGDDRLAQWPWIRNRVKELTQYEFVPPSRLTELMRGERGVSLPDAVRDGERIYAALREIARRDLGLSQSIIHGDAHAGNVFESSEGPGLVDWQLLQRGHWSLDVAYHIAAVLTVDERRASERSLLAYYLDQLTDYGVSAPEWEEAWDRYRESLAYGMFLWGITLRVDPPVIQEFNRRLGMAVADHDSLGRLGA